jgi:ElaB protein
MMDSTHKLNELFDQTDKLLAKLADERGPEIQEVRDRLGKSMAQAREALRDNGHSRGNGHSERVKVRDVAASLNDYVRNYPWIALMTGVLVASTIGILSTSATRRSLHH